MALRIEDFEGLWSLEKVIEDRRDGAVRFDGSARIAPDGDDWLYEETGKLTLTTGAVLEGRRAYRWRQCETGISIFFEDGRPFHHLPGAGGSGSHFCDPDQYDVAYFLEHMPDRWEAVWQVRGPRKDYDMTCRYRKQG